MGKPVAKATHAQIARMLVGASAPGVFGRAALAGVMRGDYVTLERMLPGVKFASRKVNQDEWELVGTCADGSTVIWRVGE